MLVRPSSDRNGGKTSPSAVGRSATVGPGGRDQLDEITPQFAPRSPALVDLDSEVSDGALQFAMAKEKLDGPEIPGPPVDQCRFGTPH